MLNNKLKVLPVFFIASLSLGIISCTTQQTRVETPAGVISDDSQQRLNELRSSAAKHTDDSLLSDKPSVSQKDQDTAPLERDVWHRLSTQMAMDLDIDNQAIRAQRDWFVSHPNYFERVAKRAERYLFHVATAIEQHNMPAELALMPIVESTYDPFAYSHARASGIWQFIPVTGERFNLKQDWWYDGRRDVVQSTDAALQYMSYLHKYFDGDWLLALAAYNSGEGTVGRAIKYNQQRGRATDFWSLNLPKETQAYVPKLLALAQLLADPEKYGVSLPKIPDQPYFESVDFESQLDLAQAAELAEISLDELYMLNPGFNQWATHPQGPHALNIPVGKSAAFRVNLNELPKEKRIGWVRYKIKKGDALSVIARRYRTTQQVLAQVNNLHADKIRIGETLLVPVASKGAEQYVLSASQRLYNKQNKGTARKLKKIHIIKSGDNIWDIARRYDVQRRDVASWNGLGTSDMLKIGQRLVIWTKPTQSASNSVASSRQSTRQVGYRVRTGDSLALIAQNFKVKISDIESWNGINREKHLLPGQDLKLYVDVTQASL